MRIALFFSGLAGGGAQRRMITLADVVFPEDMDVPSTSPVLVRRFLPCVGRPSYPAVRTVTRPLRSGRVRPDREVALETWRGNLLEITLGGQSC